MVADTVTRNLGFLIGNVVLPILVFVIALIIRRRNGLVWTSGADLYVFVTGLQLAILVNMKNLAPKINPLFGEYFVETFSTLAIGSLVLLVWSLMIEKEIEQFQCSLECADRNLEVPFPDVSYPLWRVRILWTFALALISSNMYVVLGFGWGS